MKKKLSTAIGAVAVAAALVLGAASPAMAYSYNGNKSCPGGASVVRTNSTIASGTGASSQHIWNSTVGQGHDGATFYGAGFHSLTSSTYAASWSVGAITPFVGNPYATCV
ncbi:hypothetical protein [Agromyces humi]|uniref:hypothetical protein n=1 Tax=Agromyces humi TaxID=1766800 RepID=UPI00135BC3C9|nr:hypothetical protein [Agromyces humi]